MSLLCPECLGPLALQRSTAKCTLHGGFYRILYVRPQVMADAGHAGTLAPLPAPVAAPSFVPPPPVPVVAPAAPPPVPQTQPVSVPLPVPATPPPSVVPPPPPPVVAAAPPPLPAVEEGCRRHPEKLTRLRCARCQAPVCATCAFLQADGTALCPDCGRGRPLGLTGAAPATTAAVVGVVAAHHCSDHPELPAVARCSHCGKPICQTCDFAFPPDLHYCPTCAVESTTTVTWRRKRSVIAAYVIAAWCTVGFPVFIVLAAMGGGGSEAKQTALGGLLMLFVFFPSVAGTALGVGAVDRRAGTPWWIWGAVVWNSLILAGMMLLMLIGSLSK